MSIQLNRWYVIYTKANKERHLSSFLHDKGIEHLLPMKTEIRNWSDRRKLLKVPLFPSYIFVRIKEKEEYFQVLDTEGVIGFVKNGRDIAVVRQIIIDNIKGVVENHKEIIISQERVETGKKVMIVSGPLCGLECEMIKINNRNSLIVRLDFLKRNIMVELPADILIKRL